MHNTSLNYNHLDLSNDGVNPLGLKLILIYTDYKDDDEDAKNPIYLYGIYDKQATTDYRVEGDLTINAYIIGYNLDFWYRDNFHDAIEFYNFFMKINSKR
jgi:hypothetical protein